MPEDLGLARSESAEWHPRCFGRRPRSDQIAGGGACRHIQLLPQRGLKVVYEARRQT